MPANAPRRQAKPERLHPVVMQMVEARLAARLTQKMLSEKAYISEGLIRAIERGQRLPTMSSAFAWLEACNADLMVVMRDGVQRTVQG